MLTKFLLYNYNILFSLDSVYNSQCCRSVGSMFEAVVKENNVLNIFAGQMLHSVKTCSDKCKIIVSRSPMVFSEFLLPPHIIHKPRRLLLVVASS